MWYLTIALSYCRHNFRLYFELNNVRGLHQVSLHILYKLYDLFSVPRIDLIFHECS